jgi:hypothetical protein
MNDNERPTPLTDAAWADKEQNILVHAKNLECSLAERTEERDKLLEKQSWLIGHPTAIEAAHQVVEWTKCEQERDTALAKLAKCRTALDKLHIANETSKPEIYEWYLTDPFASEARDNALETLEETK